MDDDWTSDEMRGTAMYSRSGSDSREEVGTGEKWQERNAPESHEANRTGVVLQACRVKARKYMEK